MSWAAGLTLAMLSPQTLGMSLAQEEMNPMPLKMTFANILGLSVMAGLLVGKLVKLWAGS